MSTQTWFITGASSGLGASVANAALRAGHRVAVTARDKVRLEKLTEAHPDAVLPPSMDLTKPSEIKAAINGRKTRYGLEQISGERSTPPGVLDPFQNPNVGDLRPPLLPTDRTAQLLASRLREKASSDE